MPKYEIMLLVDPKAEEEKTQKMVESIFSKQIEKFEKMDRTELAYKIKNSTTAKYYLLNVDSKPENVNEFVRKANLSKEIWRFLTINLDEEKANRELKPRKNFVNRRNFTNRKTFSEQSGESKETRTRFPSQKTFLKSSVTKQDDKKQEA